MALEGTLEEYNIVAVLQMVASGSMTGTLTVRNANRTAVIGCTEGRVVDASATFRPDRLGDILVRTHQLTPRQLDGAIAYQAGPGAGQPLGRILLDAKAITRADLVLGVQILIQEVMSEVLQWSRGQWRFEFTPPPPDALTPDEGVGIDDLLTGQMLVLDSTDPLYEPGEAPPLPTRPQTQPLVPPAPAPGAPPPRP